MRGQRALDGIQTLIASGWYAADWEWLRQQINRGSILLIDVVDLLDPEFEPEVKPAALEWTMKHPNGLPLFGPRNIDIDRLQREHRAAHPPAEPEE